MPQRSMERLAQLLEEAIRLEGADKGTLQILEPKEQALRLIAARGFSPRFIKHFRMAKLFGSSACGRAAGSHRVVIVPDVELDPCFAPNLELSRAEGFRSVKAAPILYAGDRLMGVLSTHCARPRQDWERDALRGLLAEAAAIMVDVDLRALRLLSR